MQPLARRHGQEWFVHLCCRAHACTPACGQQSGQSLHWHRVQDAGSTLNNGCASCLGLIRQAQQRGDSVHIWLGRCFAGAIASADSQQHQQQLSQLPSKVKVAEDKSGTGIHAISLSLSCKSGRSMPLLQRGSHMGRSVVSRALIQTLSIWDALAWNHRKVPFPEPFQYSLPEPEQYPAENCQEAEERA